MERIEHRWFNAKQAAEYCGYNSPSHFRKLAQDHDVPRYGPHENRYDKYELDDWMANPRCFTNRKTDTFGSRSCSRFTPIRLQVLNGGRLNPTIPDNDDFGLDESDRELRELKELRRKQAIYKF